MVRHGALPVLEDRQEALLQVARQVVGVQLALSSTVDGVAVGHKGQLLDRQPAHSTRIILSDVWEISHMFPLSATR